MKEQNKKSITSREARDTGMAMVLICLLSGLLADLAWFFPLATGLLILNMTWADAYKPVARVWLGLSQALGTIVSKMLLSVIFFLLVAPVGLVRRMMGKDALGLKGFKNNRETAFDTRNHTFSSGDIEVPY